MTDTLNAVIIDSATRADASVIWLHGLGADGHDFEAIVPALRLPESTAIRFIFPHAPTRSVTISGGTVMRAWYDIKDPDLRQTEDADLIRASGKYCTILSTPKWRGASIAGASLLPVFHRAAR